MQTTFEHVISRFRTLLRKPLKGSCAFLPNSSGGIIIELADFLALSPFFFFSYSMAHSMVKETTI
jgi:hypothetical protein